MITIDPAGICLTASARVFGVTIDALVRPGRGQPLALARQVAMALMMDQFRLNSVEVGAVLQCESSNVRHARRRVIDLVSVDRGVAAQVGAALRVVAEVRREVEQ